MPLISGGRTESFWLISARELAGVSLRLWRKVEDWAVVKSIKIHRGNANIPPSKS